MLFGIFPIFFVYYACFYAVNLWIMLLYFPVGKKYYRMFSMLKDTTITQCFNVLSMLNDIMNNRSDLPFVIL